MSKNYSMVWDPAVVAGPNLYSTTFSGGTENPLSESNGWTTGSPYQPAMKVVAGGYCVGTQTGDEKFSSVYNDSQAVRKGTWSRNQRAEVTIHKSGTVSGDLEVECLLLGTVGGPVRNVGQTGVTGETDFNGIEINLATGTKYNTAYCFAAQYLGTFADDFTAAATAFGPADGDILAAQVVMDDIALKGTVTVSIIRGGVETVLGTSLARSEYYALSGAPGLGEYRENNSPGSTDTQTNYCATAFAARDCAVYRTTFSTNETTLSESGKWSTVNQRTNFQVTGGDAVAKQVGGLFDDTVQVVNGTWRSNAEIITTMDVGSPVGVVETEHILCCNPATGSYYEVNFPHNGSYCDFVIALGTGISGSDYVYMVPSGTFSIPGGAVQTGDQLRTRKYGDTISAWIKRAANTTWDFIGKVTDTSNGGHAKWTSGQHGIGGFVKSSNPAVDGPLSAYAITDFQLCEL